MFDVAFDFRSGRALGDLVFPTRQSFLSEVPCL